MDFVPLQRAISASAAPGDAMSVTMPDGSTVRFRKVGQSYDPTNREAAYAHVREHQARGEVVTGLLYLEEGADDMHAVAGTIDRPLVELPYEALCPGRQALDGLMDEYR